MKQTINELAIKKLTETKGWQEILKVFDEEITKYNFVDNYKTEGKTIEQIALECRAREIASDIVKKTLNRIANTGNTLVERKPYI